MTSPIALRGRWFWAIALALAAASIALRAAFPIQAIATAGHDDLLFVRLADHLRFGRWLGPYDELTLAKGAGYPMFMALTSRFHIPLKIAEHVVYLAACMAFATAMGRLLASRPAALACFAILAFNPVFWVADIGGRVVRENLYVSLGLAVLAISMRTLLVEPSGPARSVPRDRRWLAGLGAVGALYWITREEGVWLVPSIAILVATFLWRHRRPGEGSALRHARVLAGILGVPVLVFAVLVGAVNALNYAYYGLFINNDFRARDFPAAYGALARIEHERWQPYVVFPADARRKAYAASPTARELAPFLEGERGEFWRDIGCEYTRASDCQEILAGWLMWVLREAIHGAGNDTADKARAFERRLAREINAACEAGSIACGPRNSSMVPPWRPEYLPRIVEATWGVARTLLTFGGLQPDVKPSAGPEHQLSRFQRVTRGPLAQPGDGPGYAASITSALTSLQALAVSALLPLAAAAWVVLAVWSAIRRRWHPAHAVIAALLCAIIMRVLLLGFLEATSMPGSNNMLYLTPVTPMTLAVAPCVLFLAINLFRRRADAAR